MSQRFLTLLLSLLALAPLSACGEEDEDTAANNGATNNGTDNNGANNGDAPTFGTAENVMTAQALWDDIGDVYTAQWSLFPGTTAQQPGMAPHGASVSIYASPEAAAALADPPFGATLLKENYDPEGNLAAITVMTRVEGFDPDNNDWFWAMFTPAGELVMNDQGVSLAGAIGDCRSCHSGAPGGDFIYTGN